MQDTGTGRSAYVFGGNAKETPIESKHIYCTTTLNVILLW